MDKSPIIFIPGILGSRLYLPDGQLVWFSLYGISRNSDKLTIENELTVKNNHVNQNDRTLTEREYGSVGLYLVLLDRLCAEFPDRKIYFFSYDFRKSCTDIAENLNEQIEYVLENDLFDKVDIVAHSMGGLVTSCYSEKYGTEKINKVITLGTPYEGAPNAIHLTVTGNFFGLPCFLFEQSGITKEMVMKYPGVIELFPSDEYIRHHHFSNDNGAISVDKADEILVKTYGDIYIESQKKISSRNKIGARKLAEMDKSYFAVGTNHITAVSVKFTNETAEDIKTKKGDGIVPYESATMLGYLEKIGTDELGRNRFTSFNVKHNNLLLAPECVSWIKDILR